MAIAAERAARRIVLTGVTGNLPPDQGRAPCLYDEQLQRQQQEKLLARGAGREPGAGERPLFFTTAGERRT